MQCLDDNKYTASMMSFLHDGIFGNNLSSYSFLCFHCGINWTVIPYLVAPSLSFLDLDDSVLVRTPRWRTKLEKVMSTAELPANFVLM